MSARDERLTQFFGCYFHQDWAIDGASTWKDVVVDYVREGRRETVVQLLGDLRSWAAEAESEGRVFLPAALRCDYDPAPDGLTERGWVQAIADAVEALLKN